MKKIIIGYLSSGYVKTNCLINFLYHFKKFKPGYPYRLVICFKNLTKKEKKKRLKLIKDKKIEIFHDREKKNDHEWGTLKRLCELNKNSKIFWMNDHAYPIKKKWLKIIMRHYKGKRLLGTSGSCSSHYNNSFYRNKHDNYFELFFKIIYFFFTVPKFPNCHTRTNGFLIKSRDFLEFIKDKPIGSKLKSFLIESGYNSLTKFFLRKKYNIFIINRDGKKFSLDNMMESQTYAYLSQNKFLISDNHIRKYLTLSKRNKLIKSKQVWGKIFKF